MRRLRPGHLLYVGLVLIPLDVALRFAGVGDVVLFCLSVVALVPLAYVIGEATEHASEHTGPAIAGLLNASFGNAPELIIALFSVQRGLFEVVRGSLTGSIVSNLLLVMGVSAIVGRRGRVGRESCAMWLGMTLFGLVLFVGPASQYWGRDIGHPISSWGAVVSAVLLVSYGVVTSWSVVRQQRAHRARVAAAPANPGAAAWRLPVSMTVLAVATVATVAVSEILTGSIEAFARQVGWSDFFVAAVLVALAGNATEHGGAVVVAYRGRLDLAGEIAFSSSAQVATMIVPAVALISLALNPLPLAFRPAELIAIGLAVVVPGLMLVVREVRLGWGVVLCVAYGVVAAGFFVVGLASRLSHKIPASGGKPKYSTIRHRTRGSWSGR